MSAPLSQGAIDELVVASHFDLPKVKTLLAEHPELLNENAEWIETPIQAAAHVNNREIAEYLLEQGAPLDICTAAVLGRAEDVRAFLAEDPGLSEARGAHNLGVLFFPALAGNIEIAEILHAAGAAINPELGQSPLIGAILGGHIRMARWLLDRDADAYATDFEGHTTLDLARKHEQQEMIDLLLPFFPDEVDAEP